MNRPAVSEDSFLLMVTERGWTQDRWLTWTTQTCLAQLFPDERASMVTTGT